MSNEEMSDYLLKHKWKQEGPFPWQWVSPQCPAAHYSLKDAYELATAKRTLRDNLYK